MSQNTPWWQSIIDGQMAEQKQGRGGKMPTLPKMPSSQQYSAMEFVSGVPQRVHEAAIKNALAANKARPKDSQYYPGVYAAALAPPADVRRAMEGTAAGERPYDFIPQHATLSFNDPNVGYGNAGSVHHDSPSVLRTNVNPDLPTVLHEAAHVDSLTAPNQRHSILGRQYPGYGTVVGAFAGKMPESENYQQADYGGAEEQAARLRALYGVQPKGTKFEQTFAGKAQLPIVETDYYDERPGERRLSKHTIRAENDADAVRLLEHSLFPTKRWIEPARPQKEGFGDMVEQAVAPARNAVGALKQAVGSWYDEKVGAKY